MAPAQLALSPFSAGAKQLRSPTTLLLFLPYSHSGRAKKLISPATLLPNKLISHPGRSQEANQAPQHSCHPQKSHKKHRPSQTMPYQRRPQPGPAVAIQHKTTGRPQPAGRITSHYSSPPQQQSCHSKQHQNNSAKVKHPSARPAGTRQLHACLVHHRNSGVIVQK